ncbi:MAG: zinc ribbon domain-containing protein, partial [Acidaminococcaceae bacterium]|nr:zinc ribbon domain-containing protein [Acidaminococcaceae bacterium]
TNADVAAEGLAGLTEKSLCEMENGRYVLRDDLVALARGLVAVHNSALLQLWDGSGSSVRSMAGYVLQGGLHDILMTTLYGGDTVRVEAMSPQELLGVFEGVMACPELPGVEAEQASDAPVFCRNCGVKLDPDTAFCGNCGAKV